MTTTAYNKLQEYILPPFGGIKEGLFALCLLPFAFCACSSDDNDDPQKDTRPTFTTVTQRPNWEVDWSSDASRPDWQEPDPTKFECSMDLMVTLEDNFLKYSSDNDMLAVFINDECRCLSYRNVMNDGRVTYLLHIKGSSEEVGEQMELRYYCEQLHYLSSPRWTPAFEPNNLMTSAYQLLLRPEDGSTKYPYHTTILIQHTNDLPFCITKDDQLGIFNGDECLGVADDDSYENNCWQIEVYSNDMTKPVQFRYYSADKGGVYTFPISIPLNGNFVIVEVKF